jgi:hypothetical protein
MRKSQDFVLIVELSCITNRAMVVLVDGKCKGQRKQTIMGLGSGLLHLEERQATRATSRRAVTKNVCTHPIPLGIRWTLALGGDRAVQNQWERADIRRRMGWSVGEDTRSRLSFHAIQYSPKSGRE